MSISSHLSSLDQLIKSGLATFELCYKLMPQHIVWLAKFSPQAILFFYFVTY